MFFGTTPQIVSQYIANEIKLHKPQRVFVPFAGNFVVEQLAGILQVPEIHSTDVSLYSKAIGHGLTNTVYDIDLDFEIRKRFPYFSALTRPIDIAAQVIFFTEVANNFKKAQKTSFYKSLDRDAVMRQEQYYKKILAKLELIASMLSNMQFYGKDACKLLPNTKANDLVFYDPPVAFGDYEKMFKEVESIYTYTPEPYTTITPELKLQQLAEMHEKGCKVYWRTNNPETHLPAGFKQVYQYKYKYTGAYCIYSNANYKTFVGSFQPLKEKIENYKMIGYEDIITENSKIEIKKVSTYVANHYRMMWVKKAQMLDSGHAFLLFVDGKLIGVLQLADALKFSSDLIVINSDPACPHSRYRRLSKLIIFLCCTQEMLKMMNDLSMWEHTGFTTRVFTNEPVSMKYRGLFDLAERAEDKEGNYKFKLIYQNRNKIFPTLAEALKAWVKKESKVLN